MRVYVACASNNEFSDDWHIVGVYETERLAELALRLLGFDDKSDIDGSLWGRDGSAWVEEHYLMNYDRLSLSGDATQAASSGSAADTV